MVEDKWLAGLRAAIDGEVQRLTQQLAGRVKELEERYASRWRRWSATSTDSAPRSRGT